MNKNYQEIKRPLLSLVIPCYNERNTIVYCVEKCLSLKEHGLDLELIIVDDCSTDGSAYIAEQLSCKYPEISVIRHAVNQGKGAALQTGFQYANGEYIGIQDADTEYNSMDYLKLIEPIAQGKADVVFGSRYLRPDSRRILYFWHTWMNRSLTFVSNMFTNLDISDMETCYKLFRKDVIKSILPRLQEKRFGFEPEITTYVAQSGCRVYECAISYEPRTYEEGKKIGWKDGIRALYCILHYGAANAPLPMQLLLYFFIGFICAVANICLFSILSAFGIGLFPAVMLSFLFSAALNYFLCIAILFRHKARWSGYGEIIIYLGVILLMCILDYSVTYGLVYCGLSPLWAKISATAVGFFGNFYLRKYIVF